jgi:hypothetical protein
MEYDRHDAKYPRTSAIANSLAYAASLVWLYADNFEAWRPSMGWRNESHPARIGDRMEYEPYKPKSSRPAGMGAFFDYGVAMAKLYAPKIQSTGPKGRPPAPQPEQAAEQRWDDEGGNS